MICPRLLVLAVLVATLSACAPAHLPTNEVAKTDNNEVEADLSCSYFYFLWGSHAEIGGRYAEAHEAYEKALICDPNVAYIREMVYGKLRPAVTKFVAEEAVRKLERRVADLEAMVRELDETLLRVVNNELTPVQQTFDLQAAE